MPIQQSTSTQSVQDFRAAVAASVFIFDCIITVPLVYFNLTSIPNTLKVTG
jgi:hypothetical protein